MAGVEYRVVDRSILLPAYRRYLVDPLLPILPRSLNPNTITHAGHVSNLAGTALLWMVGQQHPWACALAIVCLQLYLWCDNADGAHARRTQQTSVYGEFLDHGLDQLNTVYIGCLTAMALAVSPVWFVATVLLTSGAAVVTYWEQSVTGVFRLGLLNQVESLLVLSIALGVTAALGPDVWAYELMAGLSIRGAMLGWMTITILFGVARALARVVRARGAAVTAPIAAFIGLSALLVAVAAAELAPWWSVLLAGALLDVFYGMRMLALRFARRAPGVEPVVVAGALSATAVLVAGHTGRATTELDRGPAAMLSLSLVLVALTLWETRRALAHLRTLGAAWVVVGAAAALAWASEARAEVSCRPLSAVLAEGAAPARAPVALGALGSRAPIERLTFAESKAVSLVAAAGRACPSTPAGALALGVLAPIRGAAEASAWIRAFEPEPLVEAPWPVLAVMVEAGATLAPLPAALANGVSWAEGAACASVWLEEGGDPRLVWRCTAARDGRRREQTLAALVGARVESSAPMPVGPAPDPASRAAALAALGAVRAAVRASVRVPAASTCALDAAAGALGPCSSAEATAAAVDALSCALTAEPGRHAALLAEPRWRPLDRTVAGQRLLGRGDPRALVSAVTWYDGADRLWIEGDRVHLSRGGRTSTGPVTFAGARLTARLDSGERLSARLDPGGKLAVEGGRDWADRPARCDPR